MTPMEQKQFSLNRYDEKISKWWDDLNPFHKLMARFTGTLKVVEAARKDISDLWDDLIKIYEDSDEKKQKD